MGYTFYENCDCCGGGGGVTTSCCPGAIPNTLTLTVTSSGDCGCMDGSSFTLTYDSGTARWKGGGTAGGCGGRRIDFELYCNSFIASWTLKVTWSDSCADREGGHGTLSCSPLSIGWAISPGGNQCDCGNPPGIFFFTVTE
jgi:hypothetical protein